MKAIGHNPGPLNYSGCIITSKCLDGSLIQNSVASYDLHIWGLSDNYYHITVQMSQLCKKRANGNVCRPAQWLPWRCKYAMCFFSFIFLGSTRVMIWRIYWSALSVLSLVFYSSVQDVQLYLINRSLGITYGGTVQENVYVSTLGPRVTIPLRHIG